MSDAPSRTRREINQDRAADPTTAIASLARLAHKGTPDERALVASNPNAPIEALLKLAEEFPDRVAKNPSFELAQLCDPTLIENLRERVTLAFAIHPDTPPTLLARLADRPLTQHRDVKFLHHLLAHPSLPVAARDRLIAGAFADDGAAWLQSYLADQMAGDPNTPVEHLLRFARMRSPAAETFEELARNPAFPRDQLTPLLDAFPERVGRLLVTLPDTPPATLLSLIGSKIPELRRLARQHPALPADWSALLTRAGFPRSMATEDAPAFDHPINPDDMELLYEGGWWFQVYLIRRPDTPRALLERIAQGADPLQRRLLARR